MAKEKIAVIGAGNVGATAAFVAAQKNMGDVALVDIVDGIPQGKGLDMYETGSIEQFSGRIVGSNSYEIIAGASVVIMTAGFPRKPGMSREDLLQKNVEIIKVAAENIKKYAPDSIIIVVTNPLDVMTYIMRELTGFPAQRVMGQAGVLDSARMSTFIAEALDVSMEDVNAMVLGGHGDTMVPVPEFTTIGGIPITQLLDAEKIDAISNRTRKGGGEIVGLLKTGSAFYAPGSAAVKMAEAVILDKKRVIPASARLTGQYGIDNIYIGVPTVIGANGIERILEVSLNDEALASLQKSAAFYREQITEALSFV